ncbi:hypothetical protein niasHT_031581 [Heterodera trifolii]|uniref:Uncharacterized protein n=1 Tax=Heterodera trifolii TaxID=157864 RepID=A0ABD2IZD5_9BILA
MMYSNGSELDISILKLIRDSFQKLQILHSLATDQKQKEFCEHFNTYYYYKQKREELKDQETMLEHQLDCYQNEKCPQPGCAVKRAYAEADDCSKPARDAFDSDCCFGCG